MITILPSDGKRYIRGVPERQLWLINALEPGSEIFFQYGHGSFAKVFIVIGQVVQRWSLAYFGQDCCELVCCEAQEIIDQSLISALHKQGFDFGDMLDIMRPRPFDRIVMKLPGAIAVDEFQEDGFICSTFKIRKPE